MQAAAETNDVRSAIAACWSGSETGSGSAPAADPDSVQTGQWALDGAPPPCGVSGLSGDVQRTKNEKSWTVAWTAVL
jgi:hypothetical protein